MTASQSYRAVRFANALCNCGEWSINILYNKFEKTSNFGQVHISIPIISPLPKNARPCLDVHSWYFGMSLNYCIHLYVHVQRRSKGSGTYLKRRHKRRHIRNILHSNIFLQDTKGCKRKLNIDINVVIYVLIYVE